MTALLLLAACTGNPDAPPEIAYDHATCDHCSMLVSDPAYAAALTLKDGKVKVFDDPGCLFRFMLAEHPSVRHMWFHGRDRWYGENEVAFETGHVTPMGSGLMAVPAGTPGALGIGEASSRVVTP